VQAWSGGAARQVLESAAQRSWRAGSDFIDVLADVREVTERLSPQRISAIRDEVWGESSANAKRATSS